MENYTRGRLVDEVVDRDKITIPNLPQDFIWIQVSDGSKMRNMLKCAEDSLKLGRVIVLTGIGKSVGKAISCAEIMRRKFNAHQISRIGFCTAHEHWEPKLPQLDPLVVDRNIPLIHMALSKQELDATDVGYQGPCKKEVFFRELPGTERRPASSGRKGDAASRSKLFKQMTSQVKQDRQPAEKLSSWKLNGFAIT